MVAFEEFCRAKTCILFVTKEAPSPGSRIVMAYPRTIGQDKKGRALRKVGLSGERSGELDNEMARTVQDVIAATYTGVAKATKKTAESRFRFTVLQADVLTRPVLVPRYWWRVEADAALREWTSAHPSEVVTLGDLERRGIIKAFGGHGSPPGHTRKTGAVPYVKVTDLKNWRINENPTNFIHGDVAARLRKRGQPIAAGDLVSPARASSNIGQFCMVMPWQTSIVMTKEVLILRVLPNTIGLDPYLLLALLSLRVVQDQYAALALMQTNREHLGARWKEVKVPMPETIAARTKAGQPVREYFEGLIQARTSYDDLVKVFGPDAFGTRP
jgi:type I restriction enzyme M protein